ncbi:hypothetical protein F9K33_12930 [bacterium]|nr:MAG: hypothetical protein F9K33_12930 [bacterium]
MMRVLQLLLALSMYPLSDALSQSQILPKIDGKIHDDEWSDAKVFEDFTMIVPQTSEKYYDKTIVYIKQSNDAVYVAMKFWPRGRVIRQSLIRDRSTDEENEFFILLDVENKRKNGYFFAFSFLDNQRDMLIYNQRQMSQEWDWVWQNKSVIYREARDGEAGYIESEVRIPVDKIQNKNTSQIGIDVQLFAYKPDGTGFFYSISPTSELLNLKGTYIWDIKPFEERANVSINATPYIVASKLDSTFKSSFGGEVSLSLDKHKLKGTYNTDESTLEADPFDFSLYKRPIFLVEKRTFFSKDLDIYRTPINIFYTRAIQDINYGVNYTYRSNNLKTGVVYVEEEAAPGLPNSDRRKFFAARPNLIFQKFTIGSTIIVDDNPMDSVVHKTYSVDSKIDLFSRWIFQPQFVANTGGNAYRGHLYYQFNGGGGPYADIIYNRFEKGISVQTLFNNYGNNYDEVIVGGGYNFVRNVKYFSSINAGAQYYRAQRLSDNFKHQENVNTYVNYKVNDWLSVNHYFEYNRPDDETSDTTIVTRTNFLQDHNAKFIYGNHTLSVGYNFGPYYGAFLQNPYGELSLSLFSRMGLLLSYVGQHTEDFDQKIYRIKLNYRVMDKLYLRSFFQKRIVDDNSPSGVSRVTSWNSLLQYEFFAGSNVYVVLNLQKDPGLNDNRLFENSGQYFKFAYEMNF